MVAAVTVVFVTDPIEPIGMRIGAGIGAGIVGSEGIGMPPIMPPVAPPRIWALAGLAMAISAAAVVYRMVFMAWVLFNWRRTDLHRPLTVTTNLPDILLHRERIFFLAAASAQQPAAR